MQAAARDNLQRLQAAHVSALKAEVDSLHTENAELAAELDKLQAALDSAVETERQTEVPHRTTATKLPQSVLAIDTRTRHSAQHEAPTELTSLLNENIILRDAVKRGRTAEADLLDLLMQPESTFDRLRARLRVIYGVKSIQEPSSTKKSSHTTLLGIQLELDKLVAKASHESGLISSLRNSLQHDISMHQCI